MRNNTDIEKFHKRINKNIEYTQIYIGKEHFSKIVKSCRLKPYSIFTDTMIVGNLFEPHWVDEFGGSIKFDNKNISIILDNPNLIEATRMTTDLFYGNSVKQIMNNSKTLVWIDGRIFDKDCFVFCFFGDDEYFRTFVFYDKLFRASPLILGMKILDTFFEQIHNRGVAEMRPDELDCVMPIEVEKCFIEPLPFRETKINKQVLEIINING